MFQKSSQALKNRFGSRIPMGSNRSLNKENLQGSQIMGLGVPGMPPSALNGSNMFLGNGSSLELKPLHPGGAEKSALLKIGENKVSPAEPAEVAIQVCKISI